MRFLNSKAPLFLLSGNSYHHQQLQVLLGMTKLLPQVWAGQTRPLGRTGKTLLLNTYVRICKTGTVLEEVLPIFVLF